MSTITIQNLLRIVALHRFNAVAIDGGVAVEVPYTTAEGLNGTMWEECHTIREVFAALGY